MSAHTPGPWRAQTRDDSVFVPLKAIYCERIGFQIGFVNTDRKSVEQEAEANAHLIATAPELLHALVDLYSLICDMGWSTPDNRYLSVTNAAAAISKATRGAA